MKKMKVKVKQRMCKTGLLLFLVAYIFAVLTFIDLRFIALFVISLVDWVITIIPSYYAIIETEEDS